VAFGLGYLLVILVHAGLWAQVYDISLALRFAPLNVLSALSVTIAGFVEGFAVYVLWVGAILVQFVTPVVAARSAPRFDIRSAHFVERHGLLLIVAFGESVVAIGIGIGGLPLDFGVFAAALLGLAVAAALWWAYFLGDEEGALRAMASAPPDRRFRMAINGYFYAYIPMLLGVVTMAAGVKRSLGHVTEPLDLGPALALAGGVAMYLAGDVAFRRVMRIHPIAYRAVGAVLALGTVVLGTHLSAAAQLVSLLTILVTALAAEARSRRRLAVPGQPARA
jgi:low temperature requirement protein LtrA